MSRNDQFRIFSICVVKNEADVIAHSLTEAARWSDRIFVLDNDSDDGTWEILQSLASDVIVPWQRTGKPFSDRLRGEVFNHFRHEARTGDWWCRFDADEFYIDDPREFLATVPARHHVVWGIAVEYYLTADDVESLDFDLPIEQLLPMLTHYRAINSEARFCRYRERLSWPENGSWPRHVGLVHRRRITFRHYQYRSPKQIQRRLETRRNAVDRGCQMYWSEQSSDWQRHLVDAATCRVSEDGRIQIKEEDLPRHLEPLPRRLVKRVMHGSGIWP